REEALWRQLADLIIPVRFREEHQRGLREFLATGRGPLLNQRIEVNALHRDGHEFPVELTISPIRMGSRYFFSAFVHDITARKRAEKALADERNLLRSLIDNMPDYVYVKDAAGRYVLGNVVHVRLLGAMHADAVMGKTVFDFYPSELAAQNCADDGAVLTSGQALLNREEPFVDRSGRRRWHATTKVPLRDSQGNIVGLVGIGRDITERKRAEAESRKMTGVLESSIHNNPTKFVVKEARRLGFGRLNRAGGRRLGIHR